MFAIHARIAFLPVVKGGFGNPKVSAYDLGFFASFVILEGMYDLAFGESGCFHRLTKVKVFPFLISPKFGEGYRRIHRYLIHHILAKKKFSDQGIIFPVSSSILDHINDYRLVLEYYSKPLLDFIAWNETPNHNVQVINQTKDYYRFFDATKHAEFLFDCVKDTIVNIIPYEINYIANYDAFKIFYEKTLYANKDAILTPNINFRDEEYYFNDIIFYLKLI